MNFGDRYGTMGRLLHRIAFRAGTAQHALSDVEDALYADRIEGITADDPVFITSLPRSGTTILLKLLWQTGRFASHTYQDMPFVLCPLLWSRYTGQFAEEIEPTERAHGDGLEVSEESPEAFEEMSWKHFWPEHYREGHIRPWSPGDDNEEFNSFFRAHMRKVIALPTEEDGGEKTTAGRRYLSKKTSTLPGWRPYQSRSRKTRYWFHFGTRFSRPSPCTDSTSGSSRSTRKTTSCGTTWKRSAITSLGRG